MSLALNLDRRPAMERGQPKTDFRPQPTGPRHCHFGQCLNPEECQPRNACVAKLPVPETIAVVNLRKLAHKLSRSPLDEIALLVGALTYGEMMELGEALWKVKGESEVTQDALPGILHRWATGRGAE